MQPMRKQSHEQAKSQELKRPAPESLDYFTELKKEFDNFEIHHHNLIHKNKAKISDHYQFVKTIGKGGMAEVKLAVNRKTQISRAIKVLNKYHLNEKQIKQSIKEIVILARLDHPNIAQIHEYFEDERFIYVVEDLYSGGELVDKIIRDDDEEGLSEYQTAKIMKQVFSGLAHCHKNNVAYRDLKPENIMLTHNSYDNIKLVDFGLSYVYKPGEILKEKVGTTYYVAPEILMGSHTEKCDLFSAGVLMYLLLVGYPPFDGDNSQQIFQSIIQGVYTLESAGWETISDEAKNLIKLLLEPDYKKRISAEEALRHKFIQNHCEQIQIDQTILEQSLDNLKKYKKGSKLQEAIYAFIVDNIISRKEKQDLLKCFQAIDVNGDGQISKEELKTAYKTLIHHDGHEKIQNLDHIFDNLEIDFDDKLQFSDWLNASVEQKKLLSKANLEAAFQLFDIDGDGKLSVQDIKNMFACCSHIHDETWEALIKDMDKNDHNYISHSDFFHVMQQHIHDENVGVQKNFDKQFVENQKKQNNIDCNNNNQQQSVKQQ